MFFKTYIFISIIIFQSFIIYGQNSYNNGYIVTNNNDTIHGYLKDRKEKFYPKLYKNIRFKTSKNQIFYQKFNATQITEYSINNAVYKSIWIDISGNFFNEQYTNIRGKGGKIFLKVIILGYLTYYQLEYYDMDSGQLETIDLLKRRDDNYFIRATQGIFGLKKRKLSQYFKDCPELAYKIQSGQITSTLEVTIFYNNFIKN